MKITSKIATVVGAATLGLGAVPAIAQGTGATTANDTTTAYPAQQDQHDDTGKWGLVGLLGLAGLLGLKKRDRDHDDDVRRTGTGTRG